MLNDIKDNGDMELAGMYNIPCNSRNQNNVEESKKKCSKDWKIIKVMLEDMNTIKRS